MHSPSVWARTICQEYMPGVAIPTHGISRLRAMRASTGIQHRHPSWPRLTSLTKLQYIVMLTKYYIGDPSCGVFSRQLNDRSRSGAFNEHLDRMGESHSTAVLIPFLYVHLIYPSL